MSPQPISDALAARMREPEAVLEWVEPDMDVIVGLANAEPVRTIDAFEAAAETGRLRDVRLHQMMPMRPRRYIEGELPGSIAERTKRLIAIAHPNFRDELTARARELCYLL